MSGGVRGDVPNLHACPTTAWSSSALPIVVLLGMAWLIGKTRLGLFVRGVTQNRPIASCMGVNTARIDTYAFALGSGIAGLAGCALSQVGNVGPDLGQSYIVDSLHGRGAGWCGPTGGHRVCSAGTGRAQQVPGRLGRAPCWPRLRYWCSSSSSSRSARRGIFAMKGRSAEA